MKPETRRTCGFGGWGGASGGISPIPITRRNISSSNCRAEKHFTPLSFSFTFSSLFFGMVPWCGRFEWGSSLTGSFSHNLSFFYFRPIPLRFNKVAPARNDSSTLCLSLSLSFRTGMRVPLGYEKGTHCTRGTWEIPTMQCARLFTFCKEENTKVSISFSLLSSSVIFFVCLIRIGSNRTDRVLQLMTPLWI